MSWRLNKTCYRGYWLNMTCYRSYWLNKTCYRGYWLNRTCYGGGAYRTRSSRWPPPPGPRAGRSPSSPASRSLWRPRTGPGAAGLWSWCPLGHTQPHHTHHGTQLWFWTYRKWKKSFFFFSCWMDFIFPITRGSCRPCCSKCTMSPPLPCPLVCSGVEQP